MSTYYADTITEATIVSRRGTIALGDVITMTKGGIRRVVIGIGSGLDPRKVHAVRKDGQDPSLYAWVNADRAFVVGRVDIVVRNNDDLAAALADYRRGVEEGEVALAELGTDEPVDMGARRLASTGDEVRRHDGTRGVVTETLSSGMVSVMWIGGPYPVREDPADLELVEAPAPAEPVMTTAALDGVGGTHAIYRGGSCVATANLVAGGYEVAAYRYGVADPDGCSSTRRMSLADAVEWAATLAPRSGE